MDITPEQARKMLKADATNIAKKLAKGQTLTQSERSLLSAYAGSGDGVEVPQPAGRTRVPNYVELAKELGISRQAIYKHKKKENAPKRRANGDHDVAEWRRFLAEARGEVIEEPASEGGGTDDDTQAEYKKRKLRADALLQEHKLAVERGEAIMREHIEQFFASKASGVSTLLRNKLEDELPPILASMDDALEIQKMMADLCDELISTFRRGEL